jgi:hypothetical protein
MTDKIEEAKAPEVKTIFAQVRAPPTITLARLRPG